MANNKGSDGKIKLLYLVVSIVLAVVLWAYVSYVNNDVESVTIKGVKVNFNGEDLLNDNGLIITSIDTSVVDITLWGRYNTLASMDNGKIYATVDLTEVLKVSASASTNQLPVNISFDSSVNASSITNYTKTYVTVLVEKMIDREVPVRAFYKGGTAEGYVADMATASSDTVTVYGSQEAVSAISYASVTLERDNLSRSVSEPVPVKLMDAEDNELSLEGLTLSADTVTVSVEVKMVKDVSLDVNLVYCNSATSANTRCTVSPSTVKLLGDPETLEGLNVISLGTVNLTSISQTFEEAYTIKLPNGVTSLSGEEAAYVSIEVLNVETTRLSISNLSYRGADDFDQVDIVTQSLDVTVRGPSGDISAIDSDETHEYIRIVANLSELTKGSVGTFTVPAKVYVDGYTSVDAVGDYKVTVTVS